MTERSFSMKDTAQRGKDYTVTIHKTINEVSREQWDTLVQHKMFHTHQWMELLEHSVREDITPYYITVTRTNHLVGAGVCYKTSRILWKIRFSCIACTYPLSEEMPLFIKEGEDNLAIFSLLYKALEQIAHEQKAQVIFVTYVSDTSYLDFLKRKGFSLLKQVPMTYLDIQWETFTDYLRTLPRKAKKNIRHTLNQGKRRGLRLEHSHDFSDADTLFNLYNAGLEHHGYENVVPFTSAFYRNLTKYVRDYAYILRCYHGDDLLGYWIYFFDGELASMVICGLDQTAREYNAYFNICYDAVREMVEKGCSHIRFGSTTYEVKRRIGCALRRTTVSLKITNPLLNTGLKLLTFMRNIWIEREYPV